MSKLLFNEVGLSPPTLNAAAPGGNTILYLKDSTSSSHVAGEVVLVSQDAGASDDEFVEFTEFEDCPGGAATAAGATSAARIYGVCMEDIPADGSGHILLRGSIMARCEDASTNINNTTSSALIAQSGIGTIPGNLVSAADAGAGVYVKVIALYRGATAISTGSGTVVSRPVLFDGIEGFWAGEMP